MKTIVSDYIALHKAFDFNGNYEGVFANIIGDIYGECRLIDDSAGEYEIEISGHDSFSGNPILFNFTVSPKPTLSGETK
mgnify:CR=1 FL=1